MTNSRNPHPQPQPVSLGMWLKLSKTVALAGLTALYAPLIMGLQPAQGQEANPDRSRGKQASSCPAALEQMTRHSVTAGETLTSIAADYRLPTATLASFNPTAGSTPPAGTTLQIPPFNGNIASTASGDSWQSLAEQHGSRADILFEVNGCLSTVPSRIFIPSANPVSANLARRAATQLTGYPLAQPANITVSYGWQPHETKDELVFNNGIAFSVPSPTEVQSVESGTVAFVGDREGYGKLLVINHAEGVQTRYANLSDVSVAVGQSVTTDMSVGTIGGTSPTYLYFEVRTNSESGWVAQDPGQYVPALELR